MTPLDKEWLATISSAIGKTEEEVIILLKTWWYENRPLSYMNNELTKLAAANGKQLFLVDHNDN
jgi:hypothetical protein